MTTTKTPHDQALLRLRWVAIEASARALAAIPEQVVTVDSIRAAGGIVHSDGNIFFTNIDKLRAALRASSPADTREPLTDEQIAAGVSEEDAMREFGYSRAALSHPSPQGWPCEVVEADFSENTVTLQMKDAGYLVSAGEYRLIPPPEQGSKG